MIYYDFCAKLQKSIVSAKEKGELFFFYQRKAQYLCTLIIKKYDMPQSLHIAIIGGGAAEFFCGEVLDIDAITGGFNLQAAWTTGYVVGQHIGE